MMIANIYAAGAEAGRLLIANIYAAGAEAGR
jgi:hypothetical protein